MITDINKYDKLKKIIETKPLVKQILEHFSPLTINEFKFLVNNLLHDFLAKDDSFKKYSTDVLSEVLINSKILYDFEKMFNDGIDKIRTCIKYISKVSETISDNIERTTFLTINSYMTLEDTPEKVKFDILKIKDSQYDNFDLLCACLLLTINILDESKKFDDLFNDKISAMASNINSFIYSD